LFKYDAMRYALMRFVPSTDKLINIPH